MKPTLTLITGLPGSGKTHYVRSLGVFFVDDITDLGQLPTSMGESFAVVDVNFMTCDHGGVQGYLQKKYPNHHIQWVFFENNPERARANVKHRNDGRRVLGAIDLYSAAYLPPDGALEIWKNGT